MLKLFERDIAAADERLVVLAPPQTSIPDAFENVTFSPTQHQELLHEIQRLRGGIYLQDGALRRDQLTSDGRHVTPEDDRSWHLAVIDREGRVGGCIWYLEHETSATLQHLRLRHSALAATEEWGARLQSAVKSEMEIARREHIGYAEVGGWAVKCGSRCLSAGLLLILGTYSLSQIVGGALVVATATVRNSSAKILRRLGGAPLAGNGFVVPQYYDPNYECDMEILRFDTRRPAAKYAGPVQLLRRQLAHIQVIACGDAVGAAYGAAA